MSAKMGKKRVCSHVGFTVWRTETKEGENGFLNGHVTFYKVPNGHTNIPKATFIVSLQNRYLRLVLDKSLQDLYHRISWIKAN